MKIGYIGLGKMGKNMVLHLLEQAIEVFAWNRSPEPREEVAKEGATAVETIEELVSKLNAPRIIWLMLPAGPTTDEYIEKLIPLLGAGDLIIDGGNSFYKDTLKRAEKLKDKDIHFMDIGTSGGPSGARRGACLMVGGSEEDYRKVLPLIKAISAPDAYGYFGPVGSGHFAKMVHNGIEYGMMEAIGEGLAVLHAAPFKLNLAEIFRVYNNRSVIESRLVGWIEEALKEDPTLKEYSSVIGRTGEGEWTVNTAQELGVDVPVLEDSLNVRVDSESVDENSANGFRNKSVSAMRGKFGGHSVKKMNVSEEQTLLFDIVSTWHINETPGYRGFRCGNCQSYINQAWYHWLYTNNYKSPVHLCEKCENLFQKGLININSASKVYVDRLNFGKRYQYTKKAT